MKNYISASEIGDFVYCKKCWFKKINGLTETTEAMVLGRNSHVRLFSDIKGLENKQSLLLLLTFSILFLIVILLLLKFVII